MTKQTYVILGIVLTVLVLAGAVFVREKGEESAVTPAPIPQPPVITPPPPVITPPTIPAPQPAPTPEGWKTYENKEFGFAFDYPGEWEVEIKGIDQKRKDLYSYYTIYLWAPDQKDKQLRSQFGSRMIIYSSKGLTDEEKDQIRNLAGLMGKIILSSGVESYIVKNSTLDQKKIFFKDVLISIIAQQDSSLNMDIVNTFRLIK